MENIGYWIPSEGNEPILYYVLGYPDKAAREAAWRAFQGDPEWQEVARKSELNGKIVVKITSQFMTLNTSLTPAIDLNAADEARLFEMRVYDCYPGKYPALIQRFRDHALGLFEKHGIENIGYWVPLAKEDGADNTLIYILAHKSRDAAQASFAAFGKDPEWQAARKASEEGGKILAKAPESIFMSVTDYSPPVKTGISGKNGVFELRTYTTVPGKLDALHARFRDHTLALFTKHGMSHTGYWTPVDEDKGAGVKLIYILGHASQEAGLASFTAFRADPVWIAAKSASESANGGSLTIPQPDGVRSVYLRAVDFSPIQ